MFEEEEEEKVPAEQAVHDDNPVPMLKYPLGHAEHDARTDAASVDMPNQPVGQP